MLNNYFTKNKEKMFPWVKDWTDPQNHIRHSNNVRDMKWGIWFWFHPTSYKLQYYGQPIMAVVMFSIGLCIWVYFKIYILAAFNLAIVLWCLWSLITKIRDRKNIKETTMYDLYMREYPDEGESS